MEVRTEYPAADELPMSGGQLRPALEVVDQLPRTPMPLLGRLLLVLLVLRSAPLF